MIEDVVAVKLTMSLLQITAVVTSVYYIYTIFNCVDFHCACTCFIPYTAVFFRFYEWTKGTIQDENISSIEKSVKW